MQRSLGARILFILAVLAGFSCRQEETRDAAETREFPAAPAPPLLEKLAISAAPGDPVSLAYKPVEQVRWKVALTNRVEQTQGQRILKSGTRQTFELESRLVESKGDSWSNELRFHDVQSEPLDGKPDKVSAGPMEAVTRALQTLNARVTTNARGELLDLSLSGPEIERFKGMKDVVEQMMRESAVVLPDKPVAPGESWETKRTSEVERPKTVSALAVTYESTFLGWADCDSGSPGARCAAIRTTGRFTLSGRITAPGMKGRSEGEGSSDGLTVFDPARGVVARTSLTGVVSQKFILEGKEGELEFLERMETGLEWSPAASKGKTEQEGGKQ